MDNKALHVVIVYPNEVDIGEMRRIKAAIEAASGEDVRAICPAQSALICLAHAEFKTLHKGIEDAKAIGTQFLISTLASPYTTTGFQPTLAKLQKYLH